ncbi:MAG: exosortase [Candidatus Omnitrophica bacterium]|nr:exosortase [Candidatus Omnitrophota bacterium]
MNKKISFAGIELTLRTLRRIVLMSALFAAVYFPVIPHFISRFSARDSYYSHGFLIPVVSLYLVFRSREILARIPTWPHPAGFALILLGLAMYLIGYVLQINFGMYASLLPVLFGLALYLGGSQYFRVLFFPILFLGFMLPLPQVFIIGASFRLKLMAAQAATFLSRMMGIEAVQNGSMIYYPGGQILVGDPCSGLRSLIAFIALGALCAYLARGSTIKRVLLFVLAVPVALFSNLLRLTFLVGVGYVYGEKIASGTVHDVSGMLVFVLGFLCFVGLIRLLGCRIEV